MARDIRVARPFQLNGTDGVTYEWGIAYYPQVSDAIADHWYVLWNCQAAVLSRGLGLVQFRWLGRRAAPSPIWQPGMAMIWIGTEYNSLPTRGDEIEPGWPVIFRNDLNHFAPVDLPPVPDFIPVGTDPVTGETLYRPHFSADRIMRSHHPTAWPPAVKVFPGDPDPPIAAATDDGNTGRAANQEAAHLAMQSRQLREVQEIAARYVDSPPDAAPIPWPPPWDPKSQYVYVDPRDPPRAAQVAPPPEPHRGRAPGWAVQQERAVARLEKRAVGGWALG